MRRSIAWLSLSVLLSGASCLPRQTVLPDRRVPHKLATDTMADIWVQRGDGTVVRQRVRLDAGFWCVAPEVVERPLGPTAQP